LQGHAASVLAVAVTPDGRLAVSASYDKTLKVWDLASGALRHTLQGLADSVLAVAVTPQRRPALSAPRHGALEGWGPGSRPPPPCATSSKGMPPRSSPWR